MLSSVGGHLNILITVIISQLLGYNATHKTLKHAKLQTPCRRQTSFNTIIEKTEGEKKLLMFTIFFQN